MLTVGDLSRLSGISSHTIRYYIRLGLLPPHKTCGNNYRLFTTQDVQRAKFIYRAKRLGMSQQEIQQILTAGDKRDEPNKQANNLIAALVEERISIMNAEIKNMQHLQQETQQALEQFQRVSKQHENKNKVSYLIGAIANICE